MENRFFFFPMCHYAKGTKDLRDIFAIRSMPVFPAIITLFAVCQFGLLTTEQINSNAKDTTVTTSMVQAVSYDSTMEVVEEQKILKESARDFKKNTLKNVAREQQEAVDAASERSAENPVVAKQNLSGPNTPPAPAAPIQETAPAPVAPVAPVEPVPVTAPIQPVYVAPVPAPAPAPPVVQAPASRAIYVGLSGGQAALDLCQGPVLFQGSGLPYPYIAEHENCGGWWRIGSLQLGSKVSLSGLVGGNYTVGQILTVNKKATTTALTFGTQPRAILQTCVPGTNKMLVFGLY